MKSGNFLSGTVDRIGFVGYIGDTHYMTLLLQGDNQIFTVFFDGNNPASSAGSLTQPGDEVEFQVSEYGRVECKNFKNKTVVSRMQEAVADAFVRASNPPISTQKRILRALLIVSLLCSAQYFMGPYAQDSANKFTANALRMFGVDAQETAQHPNDRGNDH